MFRDYEIQSDLTNDVYSKNIKFKQFDNGATITVILVANGEAVDLAGCNILAKFKRLDQQEFSRDCTDIINNTFKIKLDSTVTAIAGVLEVDFKITKDDKQITTFTIVLQIQASIGEGNSGDIGGNTDIENQIKYISPTTFDEFVEMTSELGLFYVLSRNINITWENQTYNVIGLYDVRSHSNGLNYYGFQKMHQFVVNSTTKEITSFSSFRVYIENQIANDVELDENNLLYLVRDGAKIGTGITLPSTSGSSETLVTDYTYNSNQEIYPTALDLETGVFTCENHGLSTNDIILVVLDYRVTNIPFELYSASINYFNMLKADVIDSDTFKIKLGDTDLVYTNSNNTNVDVTKFHFEKVTSANLIKVDNLNLKNVRVEVYGKICGAYPVIVGFFDNTGISLLDNKSKMALETNGIKENNSFVTLVYEELILRNNILKLNGYAVTFNKAENSYSYLITYPNYYSNQSTITNKSLIFELKDYDSINHISLTSTIRNKISNLVSYNYFANGTKFKIYDLGEN